MKKAAMNKIKMSRAELIYQICIHTFMAIVMVLCVVPLLYVIGMSLTSEGEMIARNYFVIFPEKPIFSAYRFIVSGTNFLNGMKITLLRTILGIAASLVLTVPVGYIIAKRDLPFKKGILLFFIITMILNGGLIPNYMLMNKLHLLNNFWVYILPSFANTYGILVIKIFVEGIPADIMDSASLDGASEFQKLWNIAIPLLKPSILALGLFAAVTHWNDWFGAMVYVRDSSLYPLQYIIRNLLNQNSSADIMNNVNTYTKMTTQSMKMASVVIAVLPILCVYPFLQKYFIHGMYTGAVKE